MNLKEIALDLWPGWLMGLIMITMVLRSSYSALLRIEKKPILSWIGILVMSTALRMAVFYAFLKSGLPTDAIKAKLAGVSSIPWPAALGVFWEDACHSLPLVILGSMWPSKWAMPLRIIALMIVMTAFGLGHIYQGLGAACLLAFYIPLSMKMGKKYGFGTVIICHTLYDLFTIFLVKWMVGQF